MTTCALSETVDRSELSAYLADIYQRQLASRHDDYLAAHSGTRSAIRRQVDAFLHYLPYVQSPRILDWGCRHSPDLCLLRKVIRHDVEFSACDFKPLDYDEFYATSAITPKVLEHHVHIPFQDGSFDTVIGSGVLEHVPNDGASLDELYRVLRVGGRLIVTFLPNRTSLSELAARVLQRTHHTRLYSRREIAHMMLHHGFKPLHIRWHQVTPTLSGGAMAGAGSLADALYSVNPVLENTWGVRRLASNLLVIAEKQQVI